MRRPIICATIFAPLLALAFGSAVHAAICRVNPTGTGTGDGTNWTTQAAGLQSALTNASCTEIWVAKGVYKPGASQDDSFNIHPGVAVYGGFAGTETTRDARDFAANVTILSGDIDGDDTNTDGNFIDETSADIQGGNTQHIVVMDGTTAAGKITATTVLDGFTLTGGSAFDSGGALFCDGHAANHECSPTLTNVTFSGNSANYDGGAMYNSGYDGASSPTLTNVTFSGNSAIDHGGAMVNNGSSGGISSPTLSNVTFSGNSAGVGGAMYNFGQGGGNSSPELTNVTFSGNNASLYGGAMFNDGLGGTSSPTLSNVTFSGNSATNQGGAMFNDGRIGGTSSPTLTNVTFSGNSANYGGAIVNYGVDGSSNLTLINVILWGDTAGTGPEIYNFYATVQIDYSIVSANGCVASGIGSTCPSSGFVSADPKLGALADNGGSTRTMLPGAGSAAIDAGTCAGAPADDQRGVARPQGAGCDIGAVEVREAQLSVSATAGGSVSAGASPAANGAAIAACTSSGGTCSAYYSIPPDVATAPVVSLSAAPDAGYHLSSWGGDCASAGSSLSATVTMDQARTCSAAFAVNTTVTTLASDINPSSFGQSVTFTATVAPVAPASADPTGTVSFTDGGNAIGCDSQPLSATAPFTATCTIATLAVGNHSIIAQYGGDTNYLSPQPASNTLAQGVDTMAQVIAFTSSAPTAGVGGSYTVSATGGGSGNPVIFSIDPASTPGACTIAGSTVTFTGAGTCIIDADQAGDAHYAPAPQAQQTITVAAVPTPTPMLDRWALLLLGGFIGMLGFVRMREA